MSFFTVNIVTFFNGQVLYAPVPPSSDGSTHPYRELQEAYIGRADGPEPDKGHGLLAKALDLLHHGTAKDQRAGLSLLRKMCVTYGNSHLKMSLRDFLEEPQRFFKIWNLAHCFTGMCYQLGVGTSLR